MIVAAVATWWALSRPAAQPAPAVPAFRTAVVRTGPLLQTVRVAGTTSARNYASVLAPQPRGPERNRPMVIQKAVASGTWVKAGQELFRFDEADARDHIDDVEDQLRNAELDISKRKAEQELDMENLRQSLRVAKSDVDKARLDFKAREIRASVDQELLKLSVDETEARYNQLLQDVKQREAAQKADLAILEIARKRAENHLNRHLYDIKNFVIKSPMDGLAVIQTTFRGGEMTTLAEGDQVGAGQPLMKVVNPKSMQIEGQVNQTESSLLRIGQEARVTLDAFPGLEFKGKVYSIGALAVSGFRQQYYIRTVPVKVMIDGYDQRMIPDLSAAADVVIGKEENATLVPLGAVQEENGKSVVFVKSANGFERRAVELGARNTTHAAVISGLKAGEEVRLN
ncbi:MAG: HlyD family efflux transporter periplasmic adaptor subunit [Bryobacteraceae bacterium]|nr:HlyD family efflux transporter periplasmic adaptor subunit [Bryobacteraceae bacterium]